MVGKGSVNHNSRKFNAKNTDPERSIFNIEYCNEPIKKVYHNLFDEALKKYNEKQTRNDRKIENYYEKIRTGKQEKLFHEIIIQVGDMDNMSCLTENGELAKNILDEYYNEFQKRNPNLYVFSAHMHLDESTPHLHIDFVPFINESKRGLKTRVSLKQALAKQGFTGSGKYDTEWNRWVLSEKKELAKVMEKYGVEWEQKGTHEEHLDDYNFKKKMRCEEVSKLESEIKSKKTEAELLTKKIEHLSEAEEKITRISRNFDEEEEYQLPEPPQIMSAKTYKTKFAEPIITKLKSLVKEVILEYLYAKRDFDRWRVANANLADANKRLHAEIEYLRDEIGGYKKQLSDYRLLRKFIGSRKIDAVLSQAKAAKNHSQNRTR